MAADVPEGTAPTTAVRPRWPLALGALGYLAVSIYVLWDVLTLSVTSGATCTCSDVSQFTWFLAWPSVAISHGISPFFSTAMFHPGGVNLLANTSVTGLGLPLAPLEWLIGSTATFNIVLVITPVASGVAMMWLARRYVRREWLAFLAGAFYAFSPTVLFHQALGHLNVTFLALVPIVIGLLDDLLLARRPHPIRRGVFLGIILVWQFFIGSEVLAMVAVASALGLILIALGAAIVDRDGLVASCRHGAPGILVAGAIAIVGLIGPVLYALLGPAHYSGPVWPGLSLSDASIRSFVSAKASNSSLWWLGPGGWRFLPETYVAPLLAVSIVAGLVAFRRDRRVLVVSALAALMSGLALGAQYRFAPWHYAVHLPLLVNVTNQRYGAIMDLFLILALTLIVEHVLDWRPGAVGLVLASAMLIGSLAPYVADAAETTPFAASSLWVPSWYRVHANELAHNSVVLGFPFFNTSANLLGVQASFRMHYAVVGGTTPQWLPARQGAEAPGYRVIWDLASTAAAPTFNAVATPTQRQDVLAALAGWRVTDVVVPMTNGPNTSPVARDPAFVQSFLASILGAPSVDAGAWVWHL